MEKETIKKEMAAVGFMLAGCVVFALGLNLFVVPCNLVLGGTTGGAVVVNKLFGIPVGTASIMINVPIMLVGWKILGWKFIARTAVTSMVLGAMIDALAWVQFPKVDPILSALYGGILLGIAIGIFYQYNWSSGGSEILARAWCRATGKGTMGQAMAIVDGMVVVGGNLLLGEPANMLLALVTIFVCSKATDMIIAGYDKGMQCLIITNKGDELYHLVQTKYQRGMTCLNGRGMYTGNEYQVMMTVVKRAQFADYKKMIKAVDPAAFVIVSETYDVFGRGFKEIY
ncbi:YitT family protein [Lachnospiraceae bacterium 45-P1]